MKLAPTPLAFQGRIFFLRALVMLGFLVVAAGYYRVQILHQERYEALGEKYRIKKRRTKATRGLIYDRYGRLITQNMPTYNLVLLREEMTEPWQLFLPKISRFLAESESYLEKRYKTRSHLLSQPVLMKEDIGFPESLRIKRNQTRFPGLAIETTEKRHYAYGELMTHVLGYVGEASRQMIKENARLHMGDIVGISGIERAYNHILAGVDGQRTIYVDRRGLYMSSKVTKPPRPGGDLYLTLDFDLQHLAIKALEGRGGSIVMMDVKSGEILVYVSSPTFDLNLFTTELSSEKWQSLLSSPGHPFLNRPVQGTYAPGSIFKLVTALTALKTQKVLPGTKHFCSGELTYYNRVFHCHRRDGHGWMNLTEAIQKSCNVFFYNLANDLDVHELAKTATELGFGKLTGIDLVGEKSGLMPSPEWKKKRFNQIWFPGETLSLSIGQGNLQATPLQLVRLMTIIAAEGRAPTPHFLLKSVDNGVERRPRFAVNQIESISPRHFQLLKTAMWRVVNQNHGTGANAKVPGFDVCGKTGTAQLITFNTESDHEQDAYMNAWFAGFAPLERAEVAIIVLVEQAGGGGDKAAPIARRLLEAYKAHRDKENPT